MQNEQPSHAERVGHMTRIFTALVGGPAVAAYMRPSVGGVTFDPIDAARHAEAVYLNLVKRSIEQGAAHE